MSGKKLGIFIIFTVAVMLFLRLYKLQSIPSVVSHDEVYYLTEAKSISISGKDTSGTWHPLMFKSAHPLYAELPGTIMAPAAWFFPQSPLLAARITHAFVGVGFVLLLGAVSLELFKNKEVAIITILTASVNPWLFQFSRMSFDAIFSLFFYFLGVYLLLRFRGNSKLLSLLPFTIGFFQYQGLKIIFVPLVLLTSLYIFLESSKEKLSYWQIVPTIFKKHLPLAIVCVYSFLLLTVYLGRLQSQDAGGRVNDLIFNQETKISQQVNLERQQSIKNPLQSLFANKATVILDTFIQQYLGTFSVDQLFLKGEVVRNPFTVWTVGMFYALDAALILIGLVTLLATKRHRLAGLYLTGLLLVAPLPSAINGTGSWIMFRSSLIVPVFLLMASAGLWTLFKRLPKYLFVLVVLLYVAEVSNFLYDYFNRFPILGTKGDYFAERVVSSYVKRAPAERILILSDEERFMFESVLAYNGWISTESIGVLNQAFQTLNFSLNNTVVKNTCLSNSMLSEYTVVIAEASIPFCENETAMESAVPEKTTSIPSLIDSGDIYKIYNDGLCSQYGLERFSHIDQDVFAVESLADKEFCTNFIIRNSS